MRAIRFQEHGNEDVLEIEDVPKPEISEECILIRTEAVGVNHVDILYREGIFSPSSLPMIPGSDFAGRISEVGSKVSGLSRGDKVVGAGLSPDSHGSYSEFVLAPAANVYKIPDNVGFKEAAGIGHVGVLGWNILCNYSNIGDLDRCLIHGGSGGVGHIATQIADHKGVKVGATSRDRGRRKKLLDLGAEAVFDYTSDDFLDSVLQWGDDEINLIIDPFFDRYARMDLEIVSKFGMIAPIELSSRENGVLSIEQDSFRKSLLKDVTIQCAAVYNSPICKSLHELMTMLKKDNISVEIGSIYPLKEASRAQKKLSKGDFFGKVVLEID